MTTLPKGTTVDTSNIQQGKLIHMEFDFYIVTSIRVFTYMLTIVCKKTRILRALPTAPKQAPVCIICFILTTLNNEQHPCKHLRVDEDGALEKSTDVTNLIVEGFKIYMESTGGDASWLNEKNDRDKKIIHNMLREGA